MKYLFALLSLMAALALGTPARAEDAGAPLMAKHPQPAMPGVEATEREEPADYPLGFSTNPDAEPHYRKALGLVDDYRGLTWAGVQTAREEFQKGLAFEPDNQLAQLMWARLILRLTNYELSVESAAKIEEEARAIVEGLDLSGEDGLLIRKERASVYLYELQDLERGEEDLVYLAEHGEPDAQVLLALGQTRFYQEKYFAAKQAFRKSLEIEPDNLEARNNLAWSEYQEGDYDEAEQHFDEVLSRDEHYMGSLLGLAKIYQARGELGPAIEKYNALLEISPNFIYFLDLMILYFRHYNYVFIVLGLIAAGFFIKSLTHTMSRDKRRAAASIKIAREHGAAEPGTGQGDA